MYIASAKKECHLYNLVVNTCHVSLPLKSWPSSSAWHFWSFFHPKTWEAEEQRWQVRRDEVALPGGLVWGFGGRGDLDKAGFLKRPFRFLIENWRFFNRVFFFFLTFFNITQLGGKDLCLTHVLDQ